MNDHNLDDLIIDTVAPKNNKTKSLLTVIALFIVVLIVAIILTKTLLKSPENDELNFEENMSEMIAPELKLQEPSKEVKVAKPEEKEEELSLSTIIKEKITAPDEVKEVKETEIPTVTKKEEPVTETIKETVTINEEMTEPAIKETVKPKIEVKKPAIKPIAKPVKKPTHIKKSPQVTISGTYYVQVGSFKENPSPHFLSVIKNSGFKYHITNPDRTGYKKLLIGPYKTRAEVDKARDTIRNRIHKSAFVVQK
jgi:DedD protein